MKLTYVLFLLCFVCNASAGVFFQLEDSSGPSKVRDIYIVSCDVSCKLSIRSGGNLESTSKSFLWKSSIREIISLEKPKPVKSVNTKITGRKLHYKIITKDGDKKMNLVLGYPNIYKPNEQMIYKNLIHKIENLKNAIKSELNQSTPKQP